jgi:hypothetical protein
MNEAYRNEDPATFAKNLLTAVQTLQAVGKKVILQTPNSTSSTEGWAQNVGAYADVVRDIAKQTGTTLDDKFTYTSGLTNATSAADPVHPTAATYGLLGNNLADAIKTTTTGVAPKAISVTAPVVAAQTPSLVANQGATATTTAASNSTVKLFADTFGRAPTQAEFDRFGETIEPGEQSSFLGSARQEVVNTMPTTGAAANIASQILAQGTTDSWVGEGFGSATKNAYDMGVMLAGQGLKSINDFGQRTNANGETEFFNKATGEAIKPFYDRANGNIWGGTFVGTDSTAYGVKFDAAGNPLFYTQYGGDSADVPSWVAPALAIGAAYVGLDASGLLGGLGGPAAGAGALTAGEVAALTAGDLAIGTGTYGAGAYGAGAAGLGAAGTIAGMGAGGGITGSAAGLGINAAGTAGLGATGLGAGITAGTGLTGTGVLTGSTLGTGLLGTGAGVAGLTGTGILSGSTLGTNLLGTTGTGALTGTGVLTGSNLGTQLLGTGAGTAATVGGVTGLTNAANVGLGALGTGITTGLTGLGSGALSTGVNASGAATGAGVTAGTGLTATQIGSLLSSGLTTAGGLLQSQTSREAAIAAQARIDAETAAAKQAAAFRPIGMTTRFGTSQFQVDPVTGQLTGAGYTLSPEAKAQQDRFMALSNQGLTQAESAQGQFAPLQTGAQRLFGLGNQYLAQTPESVAQNYINQQMALLQPGRELELATLQNRLQQQGRGGLSVAQGGALGATTPELQALYNARATQEAQLAAQAQQAGQQQVLYGAGLLGQGTTAMGNYYAGQQAAYAPYTTAMGQVQGLEALGQQPYTMSVDLGKIRAQAGANVGQLGLRGAEQSVALATGQAATNNPYASLLGGLGASSAFGTAAGNVLSSLYS